ncbi:hypothetical protein ACTA71_000067 [Dictyostelium dimigraforme]
MIYIVKSIELNKIKTNDIIPNDQITSTLTINSGSGISNINKTKVFIVHGHNSIVREKVSKLIFEMGFEPIILFERPNNGLTIIEKLENEISNCKFGIVIMSPDNKVFIKNENSSDYTELVYPRLNVIFEFGYLIGKFGRSNVIYLSVPYNGKFENYDLPSDLLGYVWIHYTDDLKELKDEINNGSYRNN